MTDSQLQDAPLGKQSHYKQTYDASLLYPIARKINRQQIALGDALPFHGADIWNAYECSWLNATGKPQVAIAQVVVPCTSSHLVESKSFKLYLNSFNQTNFRDSNEVFMCLKKDLSAACGAKVDVHLYAPDDFAKIPYGDIQGKSLDDLDITIDQYYLISEANLSLQASDTIVTESLYSHLLKSNCPVTGQPDWASVEIRYHGCQLDHAELLRYIVSMRQHDEFHEMCVERLFQTLITQAQLEKLTVYARYTRRGGLDINPFRSNFESMPRFMRLARQ